MTFFNVKKSNVNTVTYRVLIDHMITSDEAAAWCKENLYHDEWSMETFENYECFYFTDKTICSIFVMIHGGRYLPPPRNTND